MTGMRARNFALRWGVLGAALAMWEVTARWAEAFFFPPFSSVFVGVYELWIRGAPGTSTPPPLFWNHFVPSVSRALAGWVLAGLIGVTVGLLLGISSRMSALFEPVVNFLRTMPPVALVPIFIIVIGFGGQMRLAMITFGCTWPVLLNTIQGVRTVDPALVETGRVFDLNKGQRLWRIYIPAASPKVFAGLRISLAIALILMVVSEMVAGGGAGGIGEVMRMAQRNFRVVEMWTGVVIIAFLGYFFNRAFAFLEWRLIGWSTRAAAGGK